MRCPVYDVVGHCDDILDYIKSGLRAREVCEERKLSVELDASEDGSHSTERTGTPAWCRICYEPFPSELELSAHYELQREVNQVGFALRSFTSRTVLARPPPRSLCLSMPHASVYMALYL
jgi:hypothetical protein